MERIAFKMKLYKGHKEAYIKRHNPIWKDLEEVLKQVGITDYSIFLDEETYTLFGVLKCINRTAFDALPQHPIMQKWWAYMKDLMETNPDSSPVSIPLEEVFYLK